MTSEKIVCVLNNDDLDLDTKINFLYDFYFQADSVKKKTDLISELHSENKFDLIDFAKNIIISSRNGELKNLGNFEYVFFEIMKLTNIINFPKLVDIVFDFDKTLQKDMSRFFQLAKVASKDINYATYFFNYIIDNIDTNYDKLAPAFSCLTELNPLKIKEFVLAHFDVQEKDMDSFLNAIAYMKYPSISDAIEIMEKVKELISNNKLNNIELSKSLKIITYIYLQYNELENEVIDIINLLMIRSNSIEVSEVAAELLFFHYNEITNVIKNVFYVAVINAEEINAQICRDLSLTITNRSSEENTKAVIEVIEKILVKHENIPIDFFYNNHIFENLDILNKLITKWLFSNDIKLSKSASILISLSQIKLLHIDTSWINNFKSEDYVFLTKKIIGWLYIHYELILNLTISILCSVKDPIIVNEILNLTFECVILNYAPQNIAFFFDFNDYTEQETKNKIIELKKEHEYIYTNIKNASVLKELSCSLQNLNLIQYKKRQENEKITKSAHEKSSLSIFFGKNIILYGEKFIYKSANKNSELAIQESALVPFSYTRILPLEYFTAPVLSEYRRQFFMQDGMKK